MDKTMKKQFNKGLTLLEMIVSLSIMVIVFAAVIPQFTLLHRSWDSKQGNAEAVQNMRVLADHMNRKLSTATAVMAAAYPFH